MENFLQDINSAVTGTTLGRLGAPKVEPRRCQNNAWPAAATNRERGLVEVEILFLGGGGEGNFDVQVINIEPRSEINGDCDEASTKTFEIELA
ncbi:hypothetical protein LguiB_023015 [Lonicera macranthoides]